MQEPRFDIFGSQSEVSTRHAFSRTSFQTLQRGAIKTKSTSVSSFTPVKNASQDVGTKLKSVGSIQDPAKSMLSCHDQENSIVMPPSKTLLHYTKLVAKTPIKRTPDFNTALRTPLTDIKRAPSAVKHPVQKSSKLAVNSKEADSLMTELAAIESCIYDNTKDWSRMTPDDHVDYNHIDNFEDIIPNSLRPTEDDIYKLVNFWEMYEKPVELNCEPMCPLGEDSSDKFVQMSVPEFDFKEPLPVPLPFEDFED